MSGIRFDLQQRRRQCPNCGRLVYLNGTGFYRRHYAAELGGRRHLCAASGHEPPDVVLRALRRLDL